MKRTISALIMPAVAGFVSAAFAQQDQGAKTIDAYISKQARKQRGEEYKEARQRIDGDVNLDGAADAVVLYTIESQQGTNNFRQYLAVFARRHGRLVPLAHAEVGGKSLRSVELAAVDGNGICLDTLTNGPDDASCCPSIKGTTRYVVVGRSLREEK